MLKIFVRTLLFNFIFYSLELDASAKAIVIGASSGMGRQVAKKLSLEGYDVGLMARRKELLQSLQNEIHSITYIKVTNVQDFQNSKKDLEELIETMGGVDLIVVSISSANDWSSDVFLNDVNTLMTDLLGFWVVADTAFKFFVKQGYGHFVGISSISGERGDPYNPVYSGSKSFLQKYMEGMRNHFSLENTPIYVTDIIPGWVEIEAEDVHLNPRAFWIASTLDAADQIIDAIKMKKKYAYITKKWQLISLLYKILPDWICNKYLS